VGAIASEVTRVTSDARRAARPPHGYLRSGPAVRVPFDRAMVPSRLVGFVGTF
jgi:hypothetical protein